MVTQANIYVVDDDDLVANSIKRSLRDLGQIHTSLTSPTQLMEALESGVVIDLMTLDNSMADATTGLEFVTMIREMGYTFPIIMVSSSATREQALAAGVNDHFPKPFDIVRLKEKAEELLKK